MERRNLRYKPEARPKEKRKALRWRFRLLKNAKDREGLRWRFRLVENPSFTCGKYQNSENTETPVVTVVDIALEGT